MSLTPDSHETVVVSTPQGSVRGVRRPGSLAFYGVPFAEPPVGANRFGAPVQRAPWSGIHDATKPGATPQRKPFAEVTAIPEPSFPGDDTLLVNVFTPDPSASLPVLVWIHGGGYKAGSPSSPWYDGFAFNRDGVVTVSVSYRLGFDGFGNIPDAPTNRGLRDQIEALRWVQQHIRAYGGDPGRVTIAGQSAGGGSVLALLSSPHTTGLIHGAISQSGSLRSPRAEDVRWRADRLADLCGVPCDKAGFATLTEAAIDEATERLADEMRRANEPGSVADALRGILAGGGLAGLPFVPHVDGDVLLSTDPVQQGRTDLPLMIGSTAHEFAMAAPMFGPLAASGEVRPALREVLGDAAEEFIESCAALPGGDATLVAQLMTLSSFRTFIPRMATARGDRPTWVYDYRFAGKGMAPHCAELPFVWDNLGAVHVEASTGPNPPQHLADVMHRAWADMISTGRAPWAAWGDASTGMIFDATSREGEVYGLERRLIGG
jgi:para-nitrobenzyl esterase